MPDSQRSTKGENDGRLAQKRCRLNLFRAGMSSAAVCIAMLLVFAALLIMSRQRIFSRLYRSYTVLAILAFFFSAVVLPVCWHSVRQAMVSVSLTSRLEIMVAVFYLSCGIAFAFLPEMGVSPIVPLMAIIILTGSVPVLEPHRLTGLLVGAGAAYLAGLLLTGDIDGDGILRFVMVAAFGVLSDFIGNARYMHFVREFHTQVIIEEKNRSLQELNEKLRLASLTDPLTGIFNRRCLDEFTGTEWEKFRSEHRMITMLMIDIDYFKHYNDMYGHIEGDRCLVRISQRIREILQRSNGRIYRFGGEEFVVIFPDMPQRQAACVAEEIRSTVESMHIHNPFNGRDCNVTTSIGLATAGERDEEKFLEVLNRADEALYKAKKQGRNCVVTYAATVPG